MDWQPGEPFGTCFPGCIVSVQAITAKASRMPGKAAVRQVADLWLTSPGLEISSPGLENPNPGLVVANLLNGKMTTGKVLEMDGNAQL